MVLAPHAILSHKRGVKSFSLGKSRLFTLEPQLLLVDFVREAAGQLNHQPSGSMTRTLLTASLGVENSHSI